MHVFRRLSLIWFFFSLTFHLFLIIHAKVTFFVQGGMTSEPPVLRPLNFDDFIQAKAKVRNSPLRSFGHFYCNQNVE